MPGLELPFMMMPHPLIPVSLPPASVTMAMSQMNHLSTIANMAAAAQVQSPPSRVETSVIKVNFVFKTQQACNASLKNNLAIFLPDPFFLGCISFAKKIRLPYLIYIEIINCLDFFYLILLFLYSSSLLPRTQMLFFLFWKLSRVGPE